MKKIKALFAVLAAVAVSFMATGCIIAYPENYDSYNKGAIQTVSFYDADGYNHYDKITVTFNDSYDEDWDINVYVTSKLFSASDVEDYTWKYVGTNESDDSTYPIIKWYEGKRYCDITLKNTVPSGYYVYVIAKGGTGLKGSAHIQR